MHKTTYSNTFDNSPIGGKQLTLSILIPLMPTHGITTTLHLIPNNWQTLRHISREALTRTGKPVYSAILKSCSTFLVLLILPFHRTMTPPLWKAL